MVIFPKTAEYQEAHHQVWQGVVATLDGPDEVTAMKVLWKLVNYYPEVRGLVLIYIDVNKTVAMKFMPESQVRELSMNSMTLSNLEQAIQDYEPSNQIVVSAYYETNKPEEYQVDTFVLQVPEFVRGARDD